LGFFVRKTTSPKALVNATHCDVVGNIASHLYMGFSRRVALSQVTMHTLRFPGINIYYKPMNHPLSLGL
jgi:hypothetical protein